MQSKTIWHTKEQENHNLCFAWHKTINRSQLEITQMLGLPNTNLKAAIIKMFQSVWANTLEIKNIETSENIDMKKKETET